MTARRHTPQFVCTGIRDVDLSAVFASALATLDHNVVPRRTDAEPALYIRAGGGYDEPWTRDAAINAWQAASLLVPDVARDTLLMVCEPDASVVAQDDQWWDQVMWILAAWHHVLVTGDREFLETALRISVATLDLADTRRDPRVGLFCGPAVMQDGISGYPDVIVSPEHAHDSFVLAHPQAHRMMCLSTNALHVLALRACADMHEAAGRDGQRWRRQAHDVASTIRSILWSEERAAFAHLALWREGDLWLDWSQETLGWALAIMAGIGSAEECRTLAVTLHREPRGVVNVWPHVQDFSDDQPGRHNVMCWPMVMGMWAQALGHAGATNELGWAIRDMGLLVHGSGGRHDEVYNARTGEPDGGWQVGRHWRSEPDQTWSATTFIGTVVYGLFGMRPEAAGLRFTPHVSADVGLVSLTDLPYRDAVLSIRTSGSGALQRCVVNGIDVTDSAVHVAAGQTGPCDVHLILGGQGT